VRRVDEAPVFVDGLRLEQPADWPPAVRGETLVDLALLLGDVDVQRRIAGPSRNDSTARRLCAPMPTLNSPPAAAVASA